MSTALQVADPLDNQAVIQPGNQQKSPLDSPQASRQEILQGSPLVNLQGSRPANQVDSQRVNR
jgi:hypothetical protein